MPESVRDRSELAESVVERNPRYFGVVAFLAIRLLLLEADQVHRPTRRSEAR